MSTPLELPCRLNATLRAPMVHLQGCSVRGSVFSAATPGLEELRLFQGCLPSGGMQGAWFKVNLERYDGDSQDWVPTAHARNLRSTEEVSSAVHIGGFAVSDGVARLVPGTPIPLRACNRSGIDARAELSARSMRVAGRALYSGDPALPSDGDVRVAFLAGDAREVSVLAAVSDGRLHLWHPFLHGLHALVALPRLGGLAAGAVPAEAMQRRLAPHARVSFWDLWPLRVIGFCCIWMGMSLLLFPNYVYPDFCGRACCCRSLPGAFVTTAASCGASWCYFNALTATTAAVVVLAPLLLVMAAGVDVPGWLRRAKVSLMRSSDGACDHSIPYHVMEATGAVTSVLSRGVRMGAFGVGLGLVVAGPAVQSFAFISYMGDIWDGMQQ